MHPIVDGLENQFQESVEFVRINASTNEGLEIFNTYSMLGHPSYLIINGTGEILWQSVGEQPAENILNAIEAAFEK